MRSEFNVLVKPLSTVKQVRSDSRNGYFVASEAWGTCFIRVSNTRECIEIYSHEGPNAQRTYTKIPAALTEKTYVVFVNYKNSESFKIRLSAGARIVGMSDAQPSKDGAWWNHSVIVYSPLGEPLVEQYNYADTSFPDIIFLESKDGGVDSFTIHNLMRGKIVRRIWVNDEFYPITKNNRVSNNLPSLVSAAAESRRTQANRR